LPSWRGELELYRKVGAMSIPWCFIFCLFLKWYCSRFGSSELMVQYYMFEWFFNVIFVASFEGNESKSYLCCELIKSRFPCMSSDGWIHRNSDIFLKKIASITKSTTYIHEESLQNLCACIRYCLLNWAAPFDLLYNAVIYANYLI
jgi:hypothetical protein